METTMKCVICGHETMAVHGIRTCYVVSSRNHTLDKGMFHPYITEDEWMELEDGFNEICENRRQCQNRQFKKMRLQNLHSTNHLHILNHKE